MTPAETPSSSAPALDSRVHHALQQSPYLSSRKLRFETEQGRVVLRGVVNSYYQKQMAQEALRRLEGVHHIENQTRSQLVLNRAGRACDRAARKANCRQRAFIYLLGTQMLRSAAAPPKRCAAACRPCAGRTAAPIGENISVADWADSPSPRLHAWDTAESAGRGGRAAAPL